MKAHLHFAMLAVLLLPAAVASGQSTGSSGRVACRLTSDGIVCQDAGCTTCNGPARASVSGDYDSPYQPISYAADACGECAGCATGAGPCVGCAAGAGMFAAAPRTDCGRIWGNLQFFHAWTKERSTPPLVTGHGNDVPPFLEAGELPGAIVLFGDEYGGDRQSAGIVELGAWLDPAKSVGIGLRSMFMEGDNESFFVASEGNGFPVYGRPFIDAQTGLEDSILVSYPNIFDGSIGVATSNEVVTAEPYLRLMIRRSRVFQFDVTAGYHFTRVNDGITITQDSVDIDPQSIAQGTRLIAHDAFDTTNEFHGGSLGFLSVLKEGRLTVRSMGKVSFGNMRQEASISGNTVVNLGGVTAESPYGLLALPTNIGEYERDVFAYVPEASITLGYRLTRCIEFTAGYHFIYWTRFAGAADQIDRTLNLSQIPDPNLIVGDPRPEFQFNDSDFWVQGITLGVNFNY